jgi:hypothetical protein
MTDSRFDQFTGMDRPHISRDGLLIDLAKCAWLLACFAVGTLGAMAADCWDDVIDLATGRD